MKKLEYLEGRDTYEIPRDEWQDDLAKWPSVSYIHVGMYRLFSSSPYTQEQLMSYKSLDCYEKFADGWVREVLVIIRILETWKRLMIAKVSLVQFLFECQLVLFNVVSLRILKSSIDKFKRKFTKNYSLFTVCSLFQFVHNLGNKSL